MGCVCEVHSGGLSDRLDVGEEREGIYRNDASCLVTIASERVSLRQEGALEREQLRRGQMHSVSCVLALESLRGSQKETLGRQKHM